MLRKAGWNRIWRNCASLSKVQYLSHFLGHEGEGVVFGLTCLGSLGLWVASNSQKWPQVPYTASWMPTDGLMTSLPEQSMTLEKFGPCRAMSGLFITLLHAISTISCFLPCSMFPISDIQRGETPRSSRISSCLLSTSFWHQKETNTKRCLEAVQLDAVRCTLAYFSTRVLKFNIDGIWPQYDLLVPV